MPWTNERNVEVDRGSGHHGGNAEDQSDQNSARKTSLKKLHEAFQCDAPFKPSPGAIILPLHGMTESGLGKKYGAVGGAVLASFTTNGSDDGPTATSSDDAGDASDANKRPG